MHVTKQHEEECDSEINLIHETINKDQAEYDKQLLTLSSAFLAVSLAFIKDVVPLKSANYVALLYTALSLLVVCILVVLAAYQIGIKGHYKAKEFWEERKRSPDKSFDEFPFGYATCVRRLNLITGGIFFVGVLALGGFVMLNIHHMRSNMTSDGKTANEAAHMNTPQPRIDEDRSSHIKVPARPPAPQPNSNPSPNSQPKQSK